MRAMSRRKITTIFSILCALPCAAGPSRATDLSAPGNLPPSAWSAPVNLPPSAWVIGVGGYGVLEPTYEGSKRYILGFKPDIDIRRASDREWLSFPNDAVGYNLWETANFHAGPAGNITLQSRFHGQDIDLRIGRADVDLSGGGFAEYYPRDYIRTRVELLQGVTGNTGLLATLSADYVWRPSLDWILTAGARAKIADDRYASDFFSTQNAIKTGFFVPFHAEGGFMSSGVELTSKYMLTEQLSAKVFIDYNQLIGDAADSPHVSLRGSAEQFIAGIGASYKFAVQP
jgi:MipA family protein